MSVERPRPPATLHEMACKDRDTYRKALELILKRATPHPEDTDADRKRDLYHVRAHAEKALRDTGWITTPA